MVYTDQIALHSHHELGDFIWNWPFSFSENNRKKNNCSSVTVFTLLQFMISRLSMY
ncbi:hypothetical protein QW060_20340 [Myroides ceti]|uniref:Uncharacterized protein n=1 Tax=Paenimyroides ceti TaxID=395087 RepID=A0ABT8CYN6_9FLAO|nr:hypothetical protein [Paenimyroides ceti]MDN3709365.1 hypothetical protein [Paenimyroides ceti]